MKYTLYRRGILLIIIFLFTFPTLTSSAEKDMVNIQGTLMELDLKQKTIVVSEKTFIWNEKTVFNNEKGFSITVDRLKPKTWVYIEGEYDKAQKRILAKKIYLLPKFISRNERHLYPFIKND